MQRNTAVPSWVRLTADERVVWTGRRSLWAFGMYLSLGVLVTFFGLIVLIVGNGVVGLLSLVLIAIGVALFLMTSINYVSVHYVLTSEEIYKKTGILSRNVINLRLDRIQNTKYKQSFSERMLSYGTISIDTAGTGGTELVLNDVPYPEVVNGHLTEQLDELSTQPGANPPM